MGKLDKLIRNIDQKEIYFIEKGKENRWDKNVKEMNDCEYWKFDNG